LCSQSKETTCSDLLLFAAFEDIGDLDQIQGSKPTELIRVANDY
jgi:hypothetical protein